MTPEYSLSLGNKPGRSASLDSFVRQVGPLYRQRQELSEQIERGWLLLDLIWRMEAHEKRPVVKTWNDVNSRMGDEPAIWDEFTSMEDHLEGFTERWNAAYSDYQANLERITGFWQAFTNQISQEIDRLEASVKKVDRKINRIVEKVLTQALAAAIERVREGGQS